MCAGIDNAPREWGWLPDRLAALGYTCVLVDQRGSGKSDRPRAPWSMETSARDVLAVMDTLGLEQPDILGFCVGGLVAQRVVQLEPQRCRSLILLASPSGIPPHPPSMRGAHDVAAIPGAAQKSNPPADVVRQLLAMGTALGNRHRMRRVTVPTLLVHGDADLVMPIANSRSLRARIPHSQLQVVPGAGHLLPTTRPDVVSRLVENFHSL
jgi:pimeloyl-ACP methyl ester carboxylesterase